MSEEQTTEEKEPGRRESPVSVSTGSSITDNRVAFQLAKGAIEKHSAITEKAALTAMAENIVHHADTNSAHVEKLNSESSTAGTAMAALGIYNGVTEGAQALNKGDRLGVAVSATDAAIGAANLTINGLAVVGKEVAPFVEDVARAGGAAVLLAQGAKAVYDTKGNLLERNERGDIAGLGSKGEVALKEVAKTGASAGVASLAGGVGTALGFTGAVAAVAVFAVDKAAEKLIDNRHAYQAIDKRNAEESKAVKYDTGGNPPVVADYRHLMAGIIQASDKIDWNRIQATPQELAGPSTMNISHQFNTRIGVNRQKAGLLDKSATIDLSVPANRAEVGRALDLEIAAQKEQIKNNDSVFPAWVRDGTRSASEMTDARDRLAWLTAAKQELKQYGDDQVMHQISFVSPVRAAFNLAASGTNSGSVAQNNNTNDLNNISAPARRLRQAPVLP